MPSTSSPPSKDDEVVHADVDVHADEALASDKLLYTETSDSSPISTTSSDAEDEPSSKDKQHKKKW